MIAGRPALSGAVQRTERLVVLFPSVDTTGAAGLSGGSSRSVTLTVTGTVTLAVPSSASTVTE